MATLPVWPPLPQRSQLGGAADHASRDSAADWIFVDPRSRELLAEVEQVAPSDASILITGETGTGKELIARHIHGSSPRRAGPFVKVSCGAFSESLVDAELFGYENGAFAGAFGAQAGWFEQANGGTIFLDEINDLPLSVQNKLLRVLQEREVSRLGGRQSLPVDVRVLAAASTDLERLVSEKRFRKDLYYRLNVISLNVLTLRERPGDIVPLARYFIETYSKRLGYRKLALAPDAEQKLMQAPWHGNVRELENVIHRTLLLCEQSEIDAASLRLPAAPSAAPSTAPSSAPSTASFAASSSAASIAQASPATDQYNGAASGSRPGPDEDMAALHRALLRLCESRGANLHQIVEDALLREAFRVSHYSQSETARLLGISRNVVRARLIRLGEIGPPRKSACEVSHTDTPSDIETRKLQ
ncbi:Nitrogen fixation protein VnfA [Pandoraea captiosa]|uniref:Nitrogen fixation protein VnfA n=1 Tax=Pandoraea captiosa TaxID=2508302 RepID=A0A5E4ZHQ5_9BURK|nr:sigma-54 dependent transcriptional regulator [Pandoraea captiosa]VVE59915.1 Nitrogen fixation protein VnfA [Pandoraea captiosa]